MQNPFVAKILRDVPQVSESDVKLLSEHSNSSPEAWEFKKDARSGSILTDDRLRVKLVEKGEGGQKGEAVMNGMCPESKYVLVMH